MHTLCLLFFLSIASLVHCQVSSKLITLDQETQDNILPCTSKFYKFVVPTRTNPYYYIEVNVTSVSGHQFNVLLSRQIPTDQVNGGVPLDKPSQVYCFAARGSTPALLGGLLQLQEFCEIADGDWYLRLDVQGTTDTGIFRILPTVKDIPPPVELLINDNVDVPGFSVTVPAPTGTTFENNDFFYFDLGKKPLTVPGSRIRIDVSPDQGSNSSIRTFMNLNRTALPTNRVPGGAECGVYPGYASGPSQTLSPCVAKQGGKWFLTVDRQFALVKSYTIKLYIEAPTVVDYPAGSPQVFYSLKKTQDIVYFQYPTLAATAGANTFVVVVDNVVNGAVTLGTLQRSLPFQDCAAPSQICSTDVSCYITNYGCNPGSGTWFFGVRADNLINPNDPLTFTISVIITPNNVTTLVPAPYGALPSSTAQTGLVRRGQYNFFKITKPTGLGDWLKIHVYADYTRTIVPADIQLFVGNDATVGNAIDSSCFKAAYTCTATRSTKDIGSCSIQLDPCQLSTFGDTIYVSVKGVHVGTFNYFFTQDRLAYTLDAVITNPNKAPDVIDGNTTIISDVVTESQYRIYSVAPFVGSFQIQATVTDDKGIAGIEVLIVFGDKVEGPTCKCFPPSIQSRVNITAANGPVVVYTSDVCQNALSKGLFVVVRGVPSVVTPDYIFSERQFALYIVKNPVSDSLKINSITLTPGQERIFNSGNYMFSLSFPRAALLNKALSIVTRASTINATVRARLFRLATVPSTCDLFSLVPYSSWSLNSTVGANDADHYTSVLNCIFASDTDSSEFLVSVSAQTQINASLPGNTGTGGVIPIIPPAFAISFNLVDTTPLALQNGVSISGSLPQNTYQHFYFDVPANTATQSNLIVEAYFDAGLQEGDDEPVTMFINSPSKATKAGDSVRINGEPSSCFCSEQQRSDKRKVVYTLNACNLVPGRYSFSLLTRTPVYTSYPSQFTIKASLVPALVGALPFDSPINFASYIGQPFTFSINIPDTFISSTSFTQRTLRINIDNTRAGDVVSAYLSRSLPSDINSTSTCSCYSVPAGFSCDTDLTLQCRISQQYCSLATAGTWYITTFVKQAAEPKIPVGFTLFASIANDHTNVITLPVSNGCGVPGKAAKVNNKQYQYFSLDTSGLTLTGQENFQIRVNNLKGGSVTFVTQRNNLPTLGCTTTASQPCTTTSCPDLTLSCGTLSTTHIGAYAQSSVNNDPVEFEVLVCYSGISSYTLNAPALQTERLPRGASQSYKIGGGIGTLDLTRAPIVSARMSLYPSAPVPNDLTISNGRCRSCVTPFRTITRQCGQADTDACDAYIFACDFPANAGSLDYYVDVVNNANTLNEITYNFEVKSTFLADTITPLPVGVDTQVSIPARSFVLAVLNITAGDLATAGILQRAELSVTTTAAAVTTFVGVGRIPFPTCFDLSQANLYVLQSCCVKPQLYYVTIRNTGPSQASVTFSPKLVQVASIVQGSWDNSMNSFTANGVVVNQTGPTEALVEVVVPFPGLASVGSLLYIDVGNDDTGLRPISTMYIESNSLAGSATSGCYTSSFQSGTPVSNTTKFTQNLYACNPLSAASLYFGLGRLETPLNTGDSLTSWNVHLNVIPEIPIQYNQPKQTFSNSHLTRNQHRQYSFTLPSDFQWTFRRIRITAEPSPGVSFTMSLKAGTPAATAMVGCPAGNFVAPSVTVTSAANGVLEVPSCSLIPGAKYYIGIEPLPASVLPIEYSLQITPVETVNSTNLTTTGVTVTLGAGTNGYYRLPDGAPYQSRDYFVITLYNYNFAVPTFAEMSWNVDGDCTTFISSFKISKPTEAQTITTLFPCKLQPGEDFHFTVIPPPGQNVDGIINYKRMTGNYFSLSINQAYTTDLKETEVAFLNLKLSPNDIAPGQTLIVSLSEVSCGAVRAWINKGGPAGPTCNINNNVTACSLPGCRLVAIDGCTMDDWNDDWWVTVQVTQQNNPAINVKFTISTAIVGSSTFRTLHTNEKHQIFATNLATQTIAQQCAAVLFAPLQPCCDTVPPVKPNLTLTPEDVHFIIPTEGAYLLDYEHIITLELTDFVASATMYVTPFLPRYCRNSTNLVPTQPSELRCSASTNSPCSVNMSSTRNRISQSDYCLWQDQVRHAYVWVDPASVVFRRGITDTSGFAGGRVPILSISSTKLPYTITVIPYDTTTKYLQFSLKAFETQYIQINHPDNLLSIPNYFFSASIVFASGPVRMERDWNFCRSVSTCDELGACDTLRPGVSPDKCATTTNLCRCSITSQRCNIGPGQQEKFVLYNPGAYVDATMKVSFTIPEETITPGCGFVTGGSQRYYLNSLPAPTKTQIYKYDIQLFQTFENQITGNGTATGRVDMNIVQGTVAWRGSLCEPIVGTNSSGTVQSLMYRRAQEPHLSVYGSATVQKNYFRLTPSLVDVPVQTMTSGTVYTSPTPSVNGTCASTTTYEYFLFPAAQAQAAGFLLVQFWGSGSVYMNIDHVTYRWGPQASYQCLNTAGYCSFIVKCGYTPNRDHYFQVVSSAFSFSVTYMTPPTPVPFTLNQTVNLVLASGSLYSYSLTVPGAGIVAPNYDLMITTTTTNPTVAPKSWLSGSTFSDCGISFRSQTTVGPVTTTTWSVSSCDLNKQSTGFLFNIFLPNPTPSATPIASCKNFTFTLTAYLTGGDGIQVINNATTFTVPQAQTRRVRFQTGTIGVGDVVYARIYEIKNGDAVLTQFGKGPHNVALINPSGIGKSVFPCSGCFAGAQFDHVAWTDECFYCTSVHDTVYVDVRGKVAAPAGNNVGFKMTVTKTQFTVLNSQWKTSTLLDNGGISDHAGDLAFYRATLTQTQGQQIDVKVTSGSSVLVQLYGDCGSVDRKYWCYKGAACQIPLPVLNNFEPGNATALAGSKVRIVVSGRSATFQIRLLAGTTGVCAPVPASGLFCSGQQDRQDKLIWSADENSTMPQKDAWALDRYNALVSGFSCPVVDSCSCVKLTQPCLDSLKKFACSESFGTCSDQGLRLTMPASLCLAVESNCGKKFLQAGFPGLTCLHSWYLANAGQWVNENGQPVPPPKGPIDLTITSAAASTGSVTPPSSSFSTTGGSPGTTSNPTSSPTSTPSSSTPTDTVGATSTDQASSTQTTGSTDQSTAGTVGLTTDSSTAATVGATTDAANNTGLPSTANPTSTASSTSNPTQTTTSRPTTVVVSANNTGAITQPTPAGLSGGAIAGIIIGVILLLLIIGAIVWFLLRRAAMQGVGQFNDSKYESILNEELKDDAYQKL